MSRPHVFTSGLLMKLGCGVENLGVRGATCFWFSRVKRAYARDEKKLGSVRKVAAESAFLNLDKGFGCLPDGNRNRFREFSAGIADLQHKVAQLLGGLNGHHELTGEQAHRGLGERL